MHHVKRSAAVVAVALLAVACGGSDEPEAAPRAPETTAEDDAFPVTVEAANGEVEIAEQPERIVSLAPVPTEMLFAIGAGDQVVAVDANSNFPEGVPTTDLSGFEPNVEAIAAYDPDLVALTDDIGSVVDGLEALDIPVLLLPAAEAIEDTYSQIERLGLATGHPDEAAEVVAGMQSDIDELTADLPEVDEPLTYYHELDNTLYTVTSATFVGEVYELAGLENIADAADDGSGYPQLSAEYLLEADPDLIFLADTKCCGQNAATVAARPGWDQLSAVRNGDVVELDDDIASRWGPRIVDFLRVVVERVRSAERVAAG